MCFTLEALTALSIRIFIALFCFLFATLVGSVLPESSFARSGNSIPTLTTKHKFPAKGSSAARTDKKKKSEIVTLTDGRNTVKKRPAAYTRAKTLSTERLRRKLSARSVVVMDAVTGKLLYSYAPDLAGQPASTIKVLTGLIAMDSLRDNQMVKVSRRAARMPRSKVYLGRGKSYSADYLVNAVLLASANDASVALAEKIGGSEKSFAKLMTAKAKKLGAANTVCKTASGLTAKGQKTTARDLAMIFKQAMQIDDFSELMGKTKVKSRDGKVLRSHNKALWRITGTEGGKTGFTNAARQTYVGKFRRGDDELVVAFLGSETMWDDVANLVKYGFAKKADLNATAAAKAKTKLARNSLLVDLDLTLHQDNPLILSKLK